MDRMQFYEINFFVDNIEYAAKNEWEMLRTHAYLCMAPHCKRLDKKKILEFPWDKEHEDVMPATEQQKQYLREQAKALEEKIALENNNE